MAHKQDNTTFSYLAMVWPWITIALIFINILISPWFSWGKNALSDLGVNKYGYIFNFAIFSEGIINGLYFSLYGNRGSSLYLMIIGSFSLALVGVFNEHFGVIHLILALIYFTFLPIYIIINSGKFNKLDRFFNLTMGILALFTIFIGILSIFKIIPKVTGLGVYETIEALLISIWISVYIYKYRVKND